jgi:hypothetical protein
MNGRDPTWLRNEQRATRPTIDTNRMRIPGSRDSPLLRYAKRGPTNRGTRSSSRR